MSNDFFNNPYWSGPYSAPSQHVQTNTNKLYVTSVDDALNRAAPRGSEMVYFHQDLNEFYVVKTDFEGRKTWAKFQYLAPNPDLSTPATKADFKELMARIEKLENGGGSDGQPDGQRSV